MMRGSTRDNRLWLLPPSQAGARCDLVEMMGAPTERLVDTNGVRLRVVEAASPAHLCRYWPTAFPNWPYSWSITQCLPTPVAEYVLVPDQRGCRRDRLAQRRSRPTTFTG